MIPIDNGKRPEFTSHWMFEVFTDKWIWTSGHDAWNCVPCQKCGVSPELANRCAGEIL